MLVGLLTVKMFGNDKKGGKHFGAACEEGKDVNRLNIPMIICFKIIALV